MYRKSLTQFKSFLLNASAPYLSINTPFDSVLCVFFGVDVSDI